jgi:hypothetical protein
MRPTVLWQFLPSLFSLTMALFGGFSLASTPAEGVGWVIIATLLVVWALYPITTLIKPKL